MFAKKRGLRIKGRSENMRKGEPTQGKGRPVLIEGRVGRLEREVAEHLACGLGSMSKY